MLAIVYSSSAATTFAQRDLEALLRQSRESNRREGLSGVLLYREGRFLQLIEGPDDTVRAKMSVIENDERHGDVRVLLEDASEHRRFPDWTMGYETTGDDDRLVPGFRRTFEDIDSDESAAGTLPALRALIGWFRERHDA